MQKCYGASDIQETLILSKPLVFDCLQDLVHVSNAQLSAYSNFKKKKSTPPHLPQTHCSLQSYALCPHLTPEVVFTNYINNLRNILSVDLICNITFTATLDITKIKICFFSGFYIFLNVIFF